MVFNRKPKDLGMTNSVAASIPVAPVAAAIPVPTIIDKLEDELRATELKIETKEGEIRELNVKAAELAGQVAWLKRTPQAVVILTALAGRFGQ